ncbi:MAG: NYN domain-containing protein [Oscillospiraceae bacterium]|nr:NYN domain-containing protein [Oscillospiraceae bacterium]
MSFFSGLFRKKIKKPHTTVPIKRQRAVVFVDYEHWFISLDRLYKTRPDIKSWYTKLAKEFEIKEVMFFGDFSNSTLRSDIPRIREITNYIIETQNASQYHKKDFTDFIMLDHIYQKAITSSDIDIFIIFSGDGHFSSVVSFLTARLGKQVGIYGIKEAISTQLKNCANWTVELPEKQPDPMLEYYQMILRNLKHVEASNEKIQGTKKIKSFPTFWGTVDATKRYNNADKSTLVKAMRSMIEKGYLYQSHERVSAQSPKKVKVINIDWNKVKNDGIWKPD